MNHKNPIGYTHTAVIVIGLREVRVKAIGPDADRLSGP